MSEAAIEPDGVTGDEPSRTDLAEVSDTFVELMRSFQRFRSRWLAEAEHDVEWSAHAILRCVANAGPMRAGAVAECVHSDPSTVSRQVAGLVKDGLLERRADPIDGRASLLAVTPRAAEVLADHDEVRLNHFQAMLADWNSRDVRRFSVLLRRFTEDFDLATADSSSASMKAMRSLKTLPPRSTVGGKS